MFSTLHSTLFMKFVWKSNVFNFHWKVIQFWKHHRISVVDVKLFIKQYSTMLSHVAGKWRREWEMWGCFMMHLSLGFVLNTMALTNYLATFLRGSIHWFPSLSLSKLGCSEHRSARAGYNFSKERFEKKLVLKQNVIAKSAGCNLFKVFLFVISESEVEGHFYAFMFLFVFYFTKQILLWEETKKLQFNFPCLRQHFFTNKSIFITFCN